MSLKQWIRMVFGLVYIRHGYVGASGRPGIPWFSPLGRNLFGRQDDIDRRIAVLRRYTPGPCTCGKHRPIHCSIDASVWCAQPKGTSLAWAPQSFSPGHNFTTAHFGTQRLNFCRMSDPITIISADTLPACVSIPPSEIGPRSATKSDTQRAADSGILKFCATVLQVATYVCMYVSNDDGRYS